MEVTPEHVEEALREDHVMPAKLPTWEYDSSVLPAPENILKCQLLPMSSYHPSVGIRVDSSRSALFDVYVPPVCLQAAGDDIYASKAIALPLILAAVEEALPILRAMAKEEAPDGG